MKGIYLTTPAPSHVTSALVNIARPGPVSASPLNMDRLTRSTHQAGPIKLAYRRGATTHPARHHRRRWWSSGPPSNPNGTGTRRRLRSSGSGCRARGHGGPAFSSPGAGAEGRFGRAPPPKMALSLALLVELKSFCKIFGKTTSLVGVRL